MARRAFTAVVVVALATTLASCAGDADPTGTTPSPRFTVEDSLTPEPSPESLANVPTECADVDSGGLLDTFTLHTTGSPVAVAPPGAAIELDCFWIAGDLAGYQLTVATSDVQASRAYAEQLPASGWTCGVGSDGDGTRCTLVTSAADGTAETVQTVLTRGDVWIAQSATNVDGEAILSRLASGIWSS